MNEGFPEPNEEAYTPCPMHDCNRYGKPPKVIPLSLAPGVQNARPN